MSKCKTVNYGWLSPTGEYYGVDWGEHYDYAYKIIEHKKWQYELEDFFNNNERFKYGMGGDFLLIKKGWVLLNSPGQGMAKPTYIFEKGMTKAQREFLFDYYIERNQEHLAKLYWKERLIYD